MITLGFDTATHSTAVALRLAGGDTAEARDDPQPGAHPGHTTRLLALAAELLAEAGVGWNAVERIAVGIGPGTFTGLRVGAATARGLAQSLSVSLTGVSSLQALAHGASLPAVLAVIDARRGEVFVGAYAREGSGVVQELISPRVQSPSDLAGVLEQLGARNGDRTLRWSALGDGAVAYRGHLEAAGAAVAPDASSLHRVSAAAICELGARATATRALEQILPDYRRRPDAEIALAPLAGNGSERVRELEGAQP